jgi:hypothetical protein
MMLNRADECRQRADECRRNAAQAADEVLRGMYLDLARRWRMMAYQANSLEQKEETKKASLLAVAGEDQFAPLSLRVDRRHGPMFK